MKFKRRESPLKDVDGDCVRIKNKSSQKPTKKCVMSCS